jgi:hypothetical protein
MFVQEKWIFSIVELATDPVSDGNQHLFVAA